MQFLADQAAAGQPVLQWDENHDGFDQLLSQRIKRRHSDS
jgi:hypothetical protein